MHFSTRKLTTIVFPLLSLSLFRFFQPAVHLHLIFISAFVHIHSPLLCLFPPNQSSRAAFVFLALVCPPHCAHTSLGHTQFPVPISQFPAPSTQLPVPGAQYDTIECRNKSKCEAKERGTKHKKKQYEEQNKS